MARDPRINVWNPVTIAVDGTTNGPDINLKDGYVGDYNFNIGGDDGYLGIEILAKNIVTGTGDGFTLTWKWQFADASGGGAGTYTDGAQIGVMGFDTDGLPQRADLSTLLGLTRSILRTAMEGSARQYARLVCTALGITNGETADTYANVADGVPGPINDGTIY